MNRLEQKFLKQLNEFQDDGLTPSEFTREGDAQAFGDGLDNPEEETFNTLAPEGYAERYIKKAKEWQHKIDEFKSWLSKVTESTSGEFAQSEEGSGTLRDQLRDIEDMFDGVTKDADGLIKSIGRELAELGEVVGEIPLEIGKKEKETAQVQGEMQ